MRLKNSCVYFLSGLSSLVFAQQSHSYFDDNLAFRKAERLYQSEIFLAAQHEFEKVLEDPKLNKSNQEAAEYYAAISGVVNDQKGAEERFLVFKENYPHSAFASTGAWELGSYYLRKGDFDKAYTYLTQNDLNDLPERKRNEYQFKLGYVHFMKGNESEALKYLEPLTQSDKYHEEASYYTGHIYYSRKEFDKAFNYFDELRKNNPDYEDKVLPYLVQIAFNNGEYEKAIEDGKTLLSRNDDEFIQSEVSKIIGESYFKLGQFNEAIPYLEAYSGEMSNADYYQLGYAYYQKGDYEKAISLFNKIVGEENPMAQTAYYQLGNAYLKTNKKQQALSAFQSASSMNYDANIQEDAFYNYAKLSYEIGNPFEGTPQVLQAFVNKYPNSTYRSEIDDLLIDSYLSSGNYKSALAALDKISNPTQKQRESAQLAAFLYGSQLFSDVKISESSVYFKVAATSNANAETKARALFWSGETEYRMGRYDEALNYFKQFKNQNITVPESKEVDYQMGYTYLKLRQYDAATISFKTYLATNPPGNFKADAKLRLADAYIGAEQTQSALVLYEEISNENVQQSDEASFNRAVVLGILGQHEEKRNALESFIAQYPDSKYFMRAKLELAMAYEREGNTMKAEEHLNYIIKNGSDEMVARARLNKGTMLYNKNDNRRSLDEFKRVAEDYPNTELALQAVENAKRIYIDENRIGEFESWASGLGYYQVNQSELEDLTYQAALNPYSSKEYNAAIPKLIQFIERYPRSAYINSAHYMLGESYYQTSQFDNAKSALTEAAKAEHPKQEDALLRLSQIYLNENQKTQALLALEALYKVSSNPSYDAFAEIHLMRLYSENGNHIDALKMANSVSNNPQNESAIKEEAKLISARSLFDQKKLNEAKTVYVSLENAASQAVQAEAFYYKAWFLNQDENYEASNNVVFDLASKFSSQQYWGSKALVVMADNYYHLDDIYQANYTLDNVIANYAEFPDVIKEAEALKSEIAGK